METSHAPYPAGQRHARGLLAVRRTIAILATVSVVLLSLFGSVSPAMADSASSARGKISTAPSANPGEGVATVQGTYTGDGGLRLTGGYFTASGPGVAYADVAFTESTQTLVSYTCTSPDARISLLFAGVKGGGELNVAAPCAPAAPEPPAPTWEQSATVVPGEAGSGTALVTLSNAGNAEGKFYAAIKDGSVIEHYTVPAEDSRGPFEVTGLPIGATLEIYGTQDGNAAPQRLAWTEIPAAPEPPAPIWNQSATIDISGVVFDENSLASVGITVSNVGSNQEGTFRAVVVGQAPRLDFVVPAGGADAGTLSGVPAGSVVEVYGNASEKPLIAKEIPAAPVPKGDPEYLGMTFEAGYSTLMTAGEEFNTFDSLFLHIRYNDKPYDHVGPYETNGLENVTNNVKVEYPACGSFTASWERADGTTVAELPITQPLCDDENEPPVDTDVPYEYTGMTWNPEAGEGTANPKEKFTTPEDLYLLLFQDGKRFDFAGPVTVDGTEPVSAIVKVPTCGPYDVYWSTTTDLSGEIRAEKNVDQEACATTPAPTPTPSEEPTPTEEPTPSPTQSEKPTTAPVVPAGDKSKDDKKDGKSSDKKDDKSKHSKTSDKSKDDERVDKKTNKSDKSGKYHRHEKKQAVKQHKGYAVDGAALKQEPQYGILLGGLLLVVSAGCGIAALALRRRS